MTTDRARRRRSMWIALASALVALIAASVLGGVAVVSMGDSTAGRDASDDVATADAGRALPWTATALIGVVDDDGVMTSTVVAVLPPEGRGGTIVSISPSTDVASGTNTTIRPLGAIFEIDGPEAWRIAVEQLTGLSFDLAEVTDAERFAQLVTPLGDLPTVFPFAFTDDLSGQTFDAGQTVLSSAAASRAVTARNPDGPAWHLDAGRDSVWRAVADRVGAGIGSLAEGVRFDRGNAPAGLDQFVDALFAAPVEFRALEATPIDPSRVAEELPDEDAELLGADADESVVTLRRSEIVLVFASIAPARIGAPLQAPTVRLVSGFIDGDGELLGMNRSDIISSALDVLLFARTNIVSVVDQPGGAVPDVTRISVTDPAIVDGVWDTYGGLFGDLQVVVSEEPIEGIELEIVLGRDFLRALEESQRAQAEAAAADAEDAEEGDS